jgi:hypothetical protein
MIDAMKKGLERLTIWLEDFPDTAVIEDQWAVDALRQAIEEAEKPRPDSSFSFTLGKQEEVLRLDHEGFHYKGDVVHDAGIAYHLFVEWMKEAALQEISDIEQALDGLAKTSMEIEQTPDDLLRQSEREGWRYAKECEAEIKRLKELAEYRLQLLMKMPENKPVMRMLSKGEDPPAKRQWVGLTDDEVHETAVKCVRFGQAVNVAIRAIEAKLRERNT